VKGIDVLATAARYLGGGVQVWRNDSCYLVSVVKMQEDRYYDVVTGEGPTLVEAVSICASRLMDWVSNNRKMYQDAWTTLQAFGEY